MLSNLCSLSLAGKQVTPVFTDLRNTQSVPSPSARVRSSCSALGDPLVQSLLRQPSSQGPAGQAPSQLPPRHGRSSGPPCAAACGLEAGLCSAGAGHASAGRHLVWKEMSLPFCRSLYRRSRPRGPQTPRAGLSPGCEAPGGGFGSCGEGLMLPLRQERSFPFFISTFAL